MNGTNNFNKTDRECSLAPTDDLIRFWGSKVAGQGHGRPGGDGIHVDTTASRFIF